MLETCSNVIEFVSSYRFWSLITKPIPEKFANAAIFVEFVALLSGSIIIEQIFRIDGVGRIYLEAFNAQDYPLLMLNVVFYTIIGLFAAILADLSYSIIDPRIRVGSGR